MIGPYEILRRLGGPAAEVYVARRPGLKHLVVIKARAADPEVIERALSHPNIVVISDVVTIDGTPYVEMEYLERGSLRPYMPGLTLAQIGGVIEGLLAGLAHAHAHGVVHRDLKPENLLLSASGHIKISDFTLVPSPGGALEQDELDGTPAYMAPEQPLEQAVGPWSDLYAVGCIASELFTGQAPFSDSDTPLAVLFRQINEPIPAVTAIRPDIDARFSDWVARLLVKAPADRTQTAVEAWRAFEAILVDRLGPDWRQAARIPGDDGDGAPELQRLLTTAARMGIVHERSGAPSGAGGASDLSPPAGPETPPAAPPQPSPAPPQPPPAPPQPPPAPPEAPVPVPPPAPPPPPEAPRPAPPREPPEEPAPARPREPPEAPPRRPSEAAPSPRSASWRSRSWALKALAAAGGLVVGIELIRWLTGALSTGPSGRGDDDPDEVVCTVFAPPAASAEAAVLVQVFSHLPSEAGEAARIAVTLDSESRQRGYRSLDLPVRRGQRITYELRLPGCDVDVPVETIIWRGRTEPVQFLVSVPRVTSPRAFFGTVVASVEGVPGGHVKFKLDAVPEHLSEPLLPAGHSARRYTAAFVSYASRDREEVLRRVQMLSALDIDYFADLVSLQPGERWERRIERGLEDCDLFLLFWSSAAKESVWVRREVEHILRRKGGPDTDADPEIRPVMLEGPPVPEPWEDLRSLHFNDRLLYVLRPTPPPSGPRPAEP